MNGRRDPHVLSFTARPTTWVGKLAYAVLGLTLLVVAFFFLTVALVTGALLALAIIGRWWWLTRALRKRARDDAIDGQYTVVERAQLSSRERPRKD